METTERPANGNANETGTASVPGMSRRVYSSQDDIHPRLLETVRRHLDKPFRGPVHEPTRRAFRKLTGLLHEGEEERLIFDSGCGTGAGTRRISELWPGHVVIGVDRSEARMAKLSKPELPFRENDRIWVRAELASFWKLAWQSGWKLRKHFLWYPNPWPKPGHLKRRWHAHPVFPVLLALGGEIEIRTNWLIYAREFAGAASLASGTQVGVRSIVATEPVTPFEAKYAASGHSLWSVSIPDQK